MATYAEDIATLLIDRALTVGTVESATGGLIAHTLTNIAGSSYFYKGSIVSYSNEAKTGVVGVRAETIERYGAVSSGVAEEMAAGGLPRTHVRHHHDPQLSKRNKPRGTGRCRGR